MNTNKEPSQHAEENHVVDRSLAEFARSQYLKEPSQSAREAHKLFIVSRGYAEGRLLFQCECCLYYSREDEQNHTEHCKFHKVATALAAKDAEIERLTKAKKALDVIGPLFGELSSCPVCKGNCIQQTSGDSCRACSGQGTREAYEEYAAKQHAKERDTTMAQGNEGLGPMRQPSAQSSRKQPPKHDETNARAQAGEGQTEGMTDAERIEKSRKDTARFLRELDRFEKRSRKAKVTVGGPGCCCRREKLRKESGV